GRAEDAVGRADGLLDPPVGRPGGVEGLAGLGRLEVRRARLGHALGVRAVDVDDDTGPGGEGRSGGPLRTAPAADGHEGEDDEARLDEARLAHAAALAVCRSAWTTDWIS